MPSSAASATWPGACARPSPRVQRAGSGPRRHRRSMPPPARPPGRHRQGGDHRVRPVSIATVRQPAAACRSSASTVVAAALACASTRLPGRGCGRSSRCTPRRTTRRSCSAPRQPAGLAEGPAARPHAARARPCRRPSSVAGVLAGRILAGASCGWLGRRRACRRRRLRLLVVIVRSVDLSAAAAVTCCPTRRGAAPGWAGPPIAAPACSARRQQAGGGDVPIVRPGAVARDDRAVLPPQHRLHRQAAPARQAGDPGLAQAERQAGGQRDGARRAGLQVRAAQADGVAEPVVAAQAGGVQLVVAGRQRPRPACDDARHPVGGVLAVQLAHHAVAERQRHLAGPARLNVQTSGSRGRSLPSGSRQVACCRLRTAGRAGRGR